MRAVLSASCAIVVGIGLGRFAYTPLMPALVAAGWLAPAEAAYLGAANLVGYLAGALLAPSLAARAGAVGVLRAMMALATASFFACAAPLSVAWLAAWRLAAGVAGGALMALAAPVVMPHVPPRRRGVAGGAIFTGVGLGIAASGTLVPPLVRAGVVETWCALGVLALALTALAWGGWPPAGAAAALPAARASRAARPLAAAPGPTAATPATAEPAARGVRDRPAALGALLAAYALNAVGLVPHMIFLVDFVARGLGRGLEAGGRYWIVFGAGAIAGPLLAGRMGDVVGFTAALRVAFVVQAVAVAMPAASSEPVALALSSAVSGAFVPGIVPLVLGRVHELVPADRADRRRAAWSRATAAFALGQAAGAWALSLTFALRGDYALLFGLGAAALAAALALDLAAARPRPRRRA